MTRANLTRMLLLAFAAQALWAQQGSMSVGDVSWKGLMIRFFARVEPPDPDSSPGFDGAVIDPGVVGGGVAQRFISDFTHKRDFGYDIRLDATADLSKATIRIEPLLNPQRAVRNGWVQFGTPLGLPQYPVIPDLYVGDTVALDLLVNPATGQKLVDYLTLEREPAPQPVHDFSLSDVQLFLERPRVTVNGQLLESTANFRGGVSGSTVWLYLQGHGRFVLSLLPNSKPGLKKDGSVEGWGLTFRDGAAEFRVSCSSTVAPGHGPFNLYVLHEPDWRPHRASDPIEVGAY